MAARPGAGPGDDGLLPGTDTGTDTDTGAGTGTGGGAGAGVRRPVRCRMCGRLLTGTVSRRTGLGPTCDAKTHPPAPDIRTWRREADQDPLPGF